MSAHAEAIAAINKLLPPNLQLTDGCDVSLLWAALFRLYGEQVQGPKGHATWKDAAVAELLHTRGVAAVAPAKLEVWFGPMPESNGKTNWTAILHKGDLVEGHTIGRSEHHDRVRYEADCVRYLIGELPERPDILAYDPDMLSPPGVEGHPEMTELLKQIAGHLTVMMGSAQAHIEGEEVTGYTIKTGALHKIIGLLTGAGHPVIVPVARAARAVAPAEVKVTDAGWAQLWVHGVHIQSGYGQEAKEKCDELAGRINAAVGVKEVPNAQG